MTHKLKQIISYLFWGAATTGVNVAAFWICRKDSVFSVQIAVGIAWFVSVLFAYITNRKYVFDSRQKGFFPLLIECGIFFTSRIFTGAIDIFFTVFLVSIVKTNEITAKIISNIVVIILNYILSLLIVFSQKKGK